MSGAQIDMEYINTIELVQLKRMNILQEGNDKVYLWFVLKKNKTTW